MNYLKIIKYRQKYNQNKNYLIVEMLLQIQVKSTIMEIFKSCNPLQGYHVQIYEINNYFHERYKEKIKCDKNAYEYILSEIDIYVSDCSLVVDIGGKEDQDENKDLIFELKRQSILKEELNCKFIKINPFNSLSREIVYIQKFINKFKDSKIKELNHKILNKLELF